MNANKQRLVSLAYQNRSKEYALSMLVSYGSSDPEADLQKVLSSNNSVVVDDMAVLPCY